MESLEKTRRRFFLEFKGKVLDFGCGRMQYATSVLNKSEKSLELFGFDIDAEAINYALKQIKRNGLSERVELIIADGNSPPFVDNCFDVIAFKWALHHFKEWKEILTKAKILLKDNGTVYIEEPLKTNPFAELGLLIYYSISRPLMYVHKKPVKQWPFHPKTLINEVKKFFLIEHTSFHGFLSFLFKIASENSKFKMMRAIFHNLSVKTKGLDRLVESNVFLQKLCSEIIIVAKKFS
ncbi:MAG: class I SAM-dependent methyltransferase [archaeon]|nr:class I SAM-dependent methyltransferase [archaeon]MCP8314579.1 class I SAM-dependent methyltransferase [archaeon]